MTLKKLSAVEKEGVTVRKREVKAVLFDLDGTLVDSYTAWFHIVNDTLKSVGLNQLKEAEFSKGFGTPVEKRRKNLYRGMMPKGEIIKSTIITSRKGNITSGFSGRQSLY